jgi:hypothetical protein
MCRSRDGEGMFVEQFFRDLGSDLMVFEEIQYLFSELNLIFFENFLIVDEIIFIDEEKHPFLDDQFSFLVDKQGDHSLIFSYLNFNSIRIFAEFGARIGADFVEQFRYFRDSFIVSRNIADETKNPRFENMAEKSVPEPLPFGSSFYQSWNVYHIEMGFLHGYRTQIWYQCRKRIVGDFCFGI